jgi:uncharacterized protein (TIGR03118 family)
VEALEDRCLLTANVLQTNLVSDLAGVAQFRDPHLVNPWGIATSSTSDFWISDNNAGVSTLYDTSGTPQSLVVRIPIPGHPNSARGTPTGTVFNTTLTTMTPGFDVKEGNSSGPAVFLFATEDGTIAGWDPMIDPNEAIIAVNNSQNPSAADGAVYKGLAIGTDSHGTTLLYAANFRSGQIDVFNTSFHLVAHTGGAFDDPNLPVGFAPFDVQVLNGKLYVTYAKQDAAKHDDVSGAGHGFVDVFNLDGTGEQRLISHGNLNSPWGLAIAPSSFGSLAGALLVGNFGNGHINAYNASTGAFITQLMDPDGEPIVIDGLWALRVGNGASGGDANKIYFTAGLDDEQHGLFGSLTPVTAGSPEGLAETQMVRAAIDVVQIDLKIVLKDIAGGVTGAPLHQAIVALNSAIVQLDQVEEQFADDVHADSLAGGHDVVVVHAIHSASNDALDMLFADLRRVELDGF